MVFPDKIEPNPDPDLDLIWGAAAIAEALNLKNERQAFYLLENGKLPAKKVGRQWVADRHALRRHFADLSNKVA